MRLNIYCIIIISAVSSLIFSQNLQELKKLESEYKKVLEKQSLQKSEEISKTERLAKSSSLPDKLIYSRSDIESLLINTQQLLDKLEYLEDSTEKMPYVGYEIFTQRDSIPFWQNIPIPKNYILGPGDEIIISMWGESNSQDIATINRDGQIFIENIGILNIGGKNLDDAKRYTISKYSKEYSTLIGQKPKSFIDLTLGELKSFNVHFVGFVNIPGIHMVHPFSNVITGLIQAGGVNNKGSLRKISIIRNNDSLAEVDIYDYFMNGKELSNIRLMDQDIVYVPPRNSTIAVTGKVLKPGYYETLKSENLFDLMNFAGGLDRKSSKTFFIHRNSPYEQKGFLINIQDSKSFKIIQGDSVHAPALPDFKNYVAINGQVKNPGKYPYNKNLNLKGLLNATSSLSNEEFAETMNLSKINIFRKNPSNINPLKIITSIENDFMLKNGDFITIPRKNILESIESIIITGEINVPGIYPVNNSTTLSEIIELSGGVTKNALNEGIEIFRDSLKVSWENKDFILIEGDSLNVLKKTGLVLLLGEVNEPGYTTFKKSLSLKNYIRRAGGFTQFAAKEDVYIIYPNGTSKPITKWSSPKVKEGSTIIVNQRTISGDDNVSTLEALSLISSQAGSFITTLLSLSLIYNQTQNGN